MKEKIKRDLNLFFVECFNAILRQEEIAIEKACQGELSVKETHLLEAVALTQKTGKNTSGGVASHLGITLGSLTVAVGVLEKKGYIEKVRGKGDMRVTYLFLTEKGTLANTFHEKFHAKMVEEVISFLDEQEGEVLISSLIKLQNYFKEGSIQW